MLLLLPFLALTASFLILIALKYIRESDVDQKPTGLPGPWSLPIIGSLIPVGLQLYSMDQKRPELLYHKLAAKYGPVFRFHVGPLDRVVVEDFDTIKHVLTSPDWTDRVDNQVIRNSRTFGQNLGLFFASGASAQKIRHFTLRSLRSIGFEKPAKIEVILQTEIAQLLQTIEDQTDTDGALALLPLRGFFDMAVFNVIWSVMTNSRFDHSDTDLRNLLSDLDEIPRSVLLGLGLLNIVLAHPAIAQHFPAYKKVKFLHDQMHQLARTAIAQVRSERASEFNSAAASSFVDVFVDELDKRKTTVVGDSSDQIITEEQMIVVITDMVQAGKETSSVMLEFACIALAYHPGVQDKVRAEIDQVCGSSEPEYSMLKRMPYLEATITEIFRTSSIVPIQIRSCSRSTKIHGSDLPKGTFASLNVYAWHMNEKQWSKPREFRPERFLSPDGSTVVNDQYVLAFGGGKRMCVGDKLAKMTVFIFLVSLLQKYRFEALEEVPKDQVWLKSEAGFVNRPVQVKIKVVPRT